MQIYVSCGSSVTEAPDGGGKENRFGINNMILSRFLANWLVQRYGLHLFRPRFNGQQVMSVN